MRPNRVSIRLTSALAIFSVVLFATSTWAASHQVLHSFQPVGLDVDYPTTGLIADGTGNLYGTGSGGAYDVGAVYELSPDGSGGWTEKVLYNFRNNGRDGTYPGASLVLDAAGNLYGTTSAGGIHCSTYGCGTAFELSPHQDGTWTEKVLHSFGNGTDGWGPGGNLILTLSRQSLRYDSGRWHSL